MQVARSVTLVQTHTYGRMLSIQTMSQRKLLTQDQNLMITYNGVAQLLISDLMKQNIQLWDVYCIKIHFPPSLSRNGSPIYPSICDF